MVFVATKLGTDKLFNFLCVLVISRIYIFKKVLDDNFHFLFTVGRNSDLGMEKLVC